MAATERPLTVQSRTDTEPPKTVFNILSKLKDESTNDQPDFYISNANIRLETDEDVLIVKKDPETNQTTINKSAYLKLHRSVSPNNRNSIDKIKENYESNQVETIESLSNKYSPSALGYSNRPNPEPKPRKSKLSRSQIITPSKKEQQSKTAARLSLNIEKNKKKDVNSNNLKEQVDNSDEEFITIITRSDSEESVLQFEKELSAFTMDNNKKKRANSFRRIFSIFSGKNKNKSQSKQDDYTDNVQNENNSFTRQAPYRHTITGDVKSNGGNTNNVNHYNEEQLEKDYAQMHINQFNKFKQNFEGINNSNKEVVGKGGGYVSMEKPIYNSTIDANNTYINMPNIRKYIDTSSSTSTLESDRSNIYQNEALQARKEENVEYRTYSTNSFRPSRMSDDRRDTPPRLMETKQDFRLVNPKALIPINSERSLPNPYQNGTYLNETYATVLDSIENRQRVNEKPPRPPSVEPTKLKLPPNRDIVPLSPRIRSPIPPENTSTEKIIATELLKPKRSPTPTRKPVSKNQTPSHQRLEIDIDYPSSKDSVISRPPISQKPSLENVIVRHRMSQASPDRITTNAQVHTPNRSLSNQSLSPMRPTNINLRPSTPSGSEIPDSPKTTPQKEDMRKSVEAYYWKEIKKLKDQENYELYLMQMQYGGNMIPYEDPVSVRRSRSMSPTANRGGRRSLSLPRETRQPIYADKYYPKPIPENRAVTTRNQMQPRSMQQLQFQQQQQQQQYFQRNTPERSTIDGSSTNSLYRPIFKRGSLSTPPRQLGQLDDSLKRKVSFSGAQNQNVQSWPTKNGFTQSPPQRRLDKIQSPDDEVFLPDLPNEEMYYNTRQNINGPYMLRASQNALYLHQRQPVENLYGQRRNQLQQPQQQQEELIYGQPLDAIRAPPAPVLTRHSSIQIQEELYGQRPRRLSYQSTNQQPPPLRREIIMNDEIFGQFGGYSTNNNMRITQPQNMYASRLQYHPPQPQKQVSVNNKVCDFYGQIHDSQQSGVLMGQLHRNPGSPALVRNSYGQLAGRSENFVRNSRLTASASDMYRKVIVPPNHHQSPEAIYGRIEQGQNGNLGAPNRPLPPVPQKRGVVRNNMVSDTESGSDASEIQRILNNSSNTKKRGIFGK